MRFRMLIGACVVALAAVGCAQSDAGITTAVKGKLIADDLVKARQINVAAPQASTGFGLPEPGALPPAPPAPAP